jgi:murein biosynthesis integral membrane protein MurJ/undecaprenyldiphospho-muramoylpentapeptide beta-N-acetylglucosaminyltransferase
MRYLLTGGGTGGHVYPNLAIAGELARHDPEAQFLYVGVRGRAEADIVPRHGIPIRFTPARGMPTSRFSPAMIAFVCALLAGTIKALYIILRYRPRLVVATGGYPSAPTLLAARLLRRPILVHEQNAYPGLVNRTFGRMAGRVAVTFPESLEHFQHNGVLVGYPVRPEILALRDRLSADERARLKQELGIEPRRTVVLITGGSLGARSINRAVADLLPRLAADADLRERVFIMHGCGRTAGADYDAEADTVARLRAHGFDETAAARFYRRERYIYEMARWLRVADAVVCRAGAGSLAETAAVGAPFLVIPKHGLPGDHQVKNAETLRAAGACFVLREKRVVEAGEAFDEVDPARLLDALRRLVDLPPAERAAMSAAAWNFVAPDCLARIQAQADRLLAPPAPPEQRVKRRRTFLVDASGRGAEVLFDRSRIGSGGWDDVRPAVAGLIRKHFWLKRTSRQVDDHVEETWTLIPRGEVRVWRAGREAPEEVDGPTRLADDDRLVLPSGEVLSFAFEWTEVTRVKSEKGALENVFSQGVGTLAAKLIGFVREAFLGRYFGAGDIMDVFAVALSLANLMREVVAEMALENAFLPSFRLFYGRSEDKRPAWRLAWQVFNLFFVLSAVITIVAILTCPWWIKLIAPGFVAKGLITQTVAMTRLMFPFLILMSISAFLGTILQSFDRFGPNAFAPVLYSLALIFCTTMLEPIFGIYALGGAVLIGGALQVVFQVVFLFRRGLREKVAWSAYRPIITAEPGVKKVLALSGPVFLDATLNKISGVVDKVLATVLISGSVSALYFSRLLIVLPFSVLAMSVTRVFLRDLSDEAAAGDAVRYRNLLRRGIDATLFLMLPTTAALIVLATPLVRAIWEGGHFTAENTHMTSLALVCYAIGLLGWSMVSLYSRVFSSQLDTRTSLITNAGSLVVYLVFALTLVQTPLKHAGLALATSLSFTFNMIWRHAIIARRLSADGAPLPLSSLAPTLGKTVAASVVMLLVMELVYVDHGPGHGLLRNTWYFGAPAVAGSFAFLAFAYLLRTRPLIELLNHLTTRLGMGSPFGREPSPPHETNGNLRTMSAAALVNEAERRTFNAEETIILRERLDALLEHDDWWVRNMGIKLAGALRLADKVGLLCDAIAARAKRPWWRRRLLGSGREAGFIRRNAVAALQTIGVYDDRVRGALLAALDDDYYEVRQYALRLLAAWADRLRGDAELLAHVTARLGDRHFEVVPLAAKAFAEWSNDADALRRLLDDPRWPVRAAAVEACRRLYDRGVITDVAALREAIAGMLLTSEMAEPLFPLKRVVKDALAGLPDEEV